MNTKLVGRDRAGRTIPPGFGSLSYVVKGTRRVFRLWVEEFTQAQALAGSVSQSQYFTHFYAKSYAPQPLAVTGRVRDQAMYDDLSEYIRDHQLLLVSTRGSNNPDVSAQTYQLPLMTFNIPSEGLVFTGLIGTFAAGAKRFNVAPQFTFDFNVIEDRHSTNNSIVPSSSVRSVFTGAFLSGPVSQRQAQAQVEQASSAQAVITQNKLASQERFTAGASPTTDNAGTSV